MDLFANCQYKKESKSKQSNKNVDAKPSTKVDIADIQSRTLERQMNEWLKQKHGMNFERVSLNTNSHIETYDHDATDTFIDEEVRSFQKKKRWGTLPKSIQWKLIQTYCKSHNEEDKLKEYRAYLETNKQLNVVYDNTLGEITSITI
jgi:predicted transcriptional regulator